MGNTWTKLFAKQTTRKVTIKVEGELLTERTEHEYCRFCFGIEVDLVGVYGTWNNFGSFKGLCKECLDRLNVLMEKGSLYDDNGKLYKRD